MVHKVKGSNVRLGKLATRKLYQPSNKWHIFHQEKVRQGKIGMGFIFHIMYPRYSGTLIPTASMITRLFHLRRHVKQLVNENFQY